MNGKGLNACAHRTFPVQHAAHVSTFVGTRVRQVDPDGWMETGFVVMADPEGNEFCLD